jgi:malate dehydrogenase (oxaloacetate-decarboxylating)
MVTEAELAEGSLFPRLRELRRVTRAVAHAVVKQAREEGVGRPLPDEEIMSAVTQAMWDPGYVNYEVK